MKNAIRDNFDVSPDAYGEYERTTGRFGALSERLFDAMSRLSTSPIETCLDAGAGTGISTRQFEARGLLTTALDLSRPMIRENPVDRRVQGDFDHLPFVENSFDAVAFTASLFLSPDPTRAAREARRVVRSEGVVGAVAPLGWTTADGSDVFETLDQQSRSPTRVAAVEDAICAWFDVEGGRWSFETTADNLRTLHAIPAMAARLYPRLGPEERVERAGTLLADIDGPLEQHWQWFVGT